jgi:2-polyprenyl-6-methoxyphenol hydroxylase-like FAD-dependent oxidoreductase
MSKKKVAIIGGGPAGASAALFLSRLDFSTIDVFEREPNPLPVGAGILMQPTGLQVLKELQHFDHIFRNGKVIHGFIGHEQGGDQIFDFRFDKYDSNMYTMGVDRGGLFYSLYNQMEKQGVNVFSGQEVIDVKVNDQSSVPINKSGDELGEYDLVVVANGAKSILREKYNIVATSEQQKIGALWAKLKAPKALNDDKIRHVYNGSRNMLGIMPIGYGENKEDGELLNFFYAADDTFLKSWEEKSLDEWKKELLELGPQYEAIYDMIESKDQVMSAYYYNVKLKPNYFKNLVFIGDAAHAMSPHLSSGTYLALLDSFLLYEAFHRGKSVEESTLHFFENRKHQLYFYHYISSMITPLFQSNKDKRWIKNNILPILYKLPYTGKVMVETLLGIRKGLFSKIDSQYYL